MKSSAIAFGIVSAVVVISTAAGLWAQHQRERPGETAARATGLEIAVYKTPT